MANPPSRPIRIPRPKSYTRPTAASVHVVQERIYLMAFPLKSMTRDPQEMYRRGEAWAFYSLVARERGTEQVEAHQMIRDRRDAAEAAGYRLGWEWENLLPSNVLEQFWQWRAEVLNS